MGRAPLGIREEWVGGGVSSKCALSYCLSHKMFDLRSLKLSVVETLTTLSLSLSVSVSLYPDLNLIILTNGGV